MRLTPIGPSPSGSTLLTRSGSPARIALRSAPAQNFPPAPVSTATDRSGSASKRRNASASASAVGRSTAFATSGRSIVTVTISPSGS
jgi:hypothetical protein